MKFVKGISLFFLYPTMFLVVGFYGGVKATHFFYPGEQSVQREQEISKLSAEIDVGGNMPEEEEELHDEVMEVAASSETLNVDTKYVLEETDILNHTTEETTMRLPHKYVGMNRDQFLEAMEIYENSPPLTELERGFVSLEVLSFSTERVVVQMNYKYVQPSTSFYLAVYDNKVIVYLEDMKTVYIETDIMLDTLSDELQRSIIEMMWIENEEKLYNFLENYSS